MECIKLSFRFNPKNKLVDALIWEAEGKTYTIPVSDLPGGERQDASMIGATNPHFRGELWAKHFPVDEQRQARIRQWAKRLRNEDAKQND